MNSKLINRLKRNKGQIESLITQIENGDPCENILVQFQASQSALDSAFVLFLETNIEACLENGEIDTIKKLLPQIIKR